MSAVDVDKLTSECKDMLPLISAYIDDELSDEKRASVEAHLDECPLCRLAMEEMTEASKSYRGIIPLIPPAALKTGVLERLAQMPRGGATGGEGQPGTSAAQEMSKPDIEAGDSAKPTSETAKSADGLGGDEPTTQTSAMSDTVARRVKKSAERRGAREALRRFMTGLTPAQKALVATVGAVIVAGTILGIVLGLAHRSGPLVTPKPAVTDTRPGTALQPTPADAEKNAADLVEDSALEEEPPAVETDEGGTTAPGVEPTTTPPDDSQLGDQPGDVNLPDETTKTSPDY